MMPIIWCIIAELFCFLDFFVANYLVVYEAWAALAETSEYLLEWKVFWASHKLFFSSLQTILVFD